MTKRLAITAVSLIVILSVAGCRSTLGPLAKKNTILMSLSSDNTITVAGRRTQVPELSKQLKSMGAPSDAKIKISIPKGTPKGVLSAITSQLASNGYSKIVFTGPKQVDAYRNKK